jgi:hypothetical protein
MLFYRQSRSSKGLTTVALVLCITFCALLPLSLLSFEILRFALIQEQLQSLTDSAALSGTAAIASAPSAPQKNPGTGYAYTFADREYISMTVAAETFCQNTILQTGFSLANIPSSSDGTTGYTNPNPGPYNVSANLNPVPPVAQSPVAHSAILNIVLHDQNNDQVTTGNPATSIQVQAYYSDAPVFLGAQSGGWHIAGNLGENYTYTVCAISNGGLPSIDLMLCFDTSGSMDDQTQAALVERYWSGTAVTYTKFSNSTLFNLFGFPAVGSQVNVFFPQNLSYGAYPATKSGGVVVSGNRYPYVFSETPVNPAINPNGGVLIGLRAANSSTLSTEMTNAGLSYANYTTTTMPEAGLPPGNWDPNHPTVDPLFPNSGPNGNGLNPTVIANAFTDLVVVPTSYPVTVTNVVNGMPLSLTFANIQQLVEASRGNCESSASLNQALCNQFNSTVKNSSFKTFTPAAGYYNAYWLFVLQNAAPISQAQAAAWDFYNTMHLSANSHFGLETFAGCAATTTGATNGDTSIAISSSGQNELLGPINNIDPNYLPGYQTSFPLACVTVNQNSDNYNLITGSFLPATTSQYPPAANPYATLGSNLPLLPTTSTDIADAINQAVTIISSSTYTRTTAKKAIVLFTDGVPNQPGGSEAAAYSSAIAQAQQAGALTPVIPIYTIGLSQNTSILPDENNLLGDGQGSNPKGIAYYSAPNVATYYSVQNPQNLNSAFQQIARSLCVITGN